MTKSSQIWSGLLRNYLTKWAKANAVAIQYTRVLEVESEHLHRALQPHFHEEVLDQHRFFRLNDVREATHRRMIDYTKRLHDPVGRLTPIEHLNKPIESSTFEMSA